MTWKDSGNGKDPWQNRGNQPEDLDQMFEAWQKRLTGIFRGNAGNKQGPKGMKITSGGSILLIFILLAWAFTGLYRIDEAERGVVQRFGAYTKTTLPGLHWRFPYPIDRVDIVNTNEIVNFPFRTEILTGSVRRYCTTI